MKVKSIVTHYEESEGMKKGVPYKVFISSPSDVKLYRDATSSVIEELNQQYIKQTNSLFFKPFLWEESMNARMVSKGQTYQDEIFKDFGDHCDIFILLLWTKIGAGGTEKEYQEFLSNYRERNSNALFLVALIEEPIQPKKIDSEQFHAKEQFVEANWNNWIALGGERGTIIDVPSFEKLLRVSLQEFMSNQA